MINVTVVWKQVTIVLLGAIGVIAVGAFGLATLRDNLLEERRALAHHTVDLGYRVLAEYGEREAAGLLDHAEAQRRAKERLRGLGIGKPEYFWIMDPEYRVVMHPYFPQYEGANFGEMDNPRLAEGGGGGGGVDRHCRYGETRAGGLHLLSLDAA